jgi:amidase
LRFFITLVVTFGLIVIAASSVAAWPTSEKLVGAYLARIEAIDREGPALHSVPALNPNALAEARTLDTERARASCAVLCAVCPFF